MIAPRVTVLIDTYNYGRFIEQAIDCVLSQDFPADQMEILVVDDGSTDDTSDRVKKYGDRIRYLRKENGGQASAFNFGFAHAQGELILTLDADDYFLPGKIRRVVNAFDQNPQAGMAYHARLELLEATGKTIEPEFNAISGFFPDDRRLSLRYDLQPTSCLAFRRTLLQHVLPVPESLRIQADGHLGLLMPLVAPIIAIPEPLSVYRVHGQNLFYVDEKAASLERRQKWVQSFSGVIRETQKWAKANPVPLNGAATWCYVERWVQPLDERSFEARAPGRLRYFWFLLRQNYVHACVQSWKYTLFNYATAPVALLLGYSASQSANEKALRTLQTLVRR